MQIPKSHPHAQQFFRLLPARRIRRDLHRYALRLRPAGIARKRVHAKRDHAGGQDHDGERGADQHRYVGDRLPSPQIHGGATGGIMNHLEIGTVVNVMIIHTPSNSIIYENEVSVTP